MFDIILMNSLRRYRPTVCVTGAGAGVDSAWEQEKLEARKILENAAESHTSGARFVGCGFWKSINQIISLIYKFALIEYL